MMHPVVAGYGPLDARLILLGERPGREEMAQGRPFVGATGKVVEEALGGWGGVRRTNVRCYLNERESDDAKAEGYRECREHLVTELAAMSGARTLLALGADAARFAVGRGDITKLHGSTFTRREAEAMRGAPLPPSLHSVVISFHPAYAMRGMAQEMPWIKQAIAWARTLSGRESFGRPKMELILQPTVDGLRSYLARNRDPVAIDIETPRDNPTKIIMVGVSISDDSACVATWSEAVADVLAEVLSDPTRVKLGHNFAYDLRAFMAAGIDPQWPIVDTIHAEALLCPPFKEARKRRRLSLAACIARRVRGWAFHKEPDNPATRELYRSWFPEVPDFLHPKAYCGLDSAGDRALYNEQMPVLAAKGMVGLLREVVSPAALVLVRMESRGIPVNEQCRAQIRAQIQEEIGELRARIEEFTRARYAARHARLGESLRAAESAIATLRAGDPAASGMGPPCADHPEYHGETRREKCPSCRSTYLSAGPYRARLEELRGAARRCRIKLKQVGESFEAGNDNHWRWLLFDADTGLGLMPVAETEGGLPSVDEDSVDELIRLYPDVEVLAWRGGVKSGLRRLAGILAAPLDSRGRAHFAFSLHRTENGRVASGTDDEEEEKIHESQAGNAQNVADEDRRVFVAPDGWSAVELDMKQVELRVMAWLAKDGPLLEALWSGRDIHSENTAEIWGCELGAARKHTVKLRGRMVKARDETKTITHGWDYGRGDAAVGRATQPWAGKEIGEVVKFLVETGSLTEESWRRRARAAERSPEPVVEARKLRARIYELANTITAKGWREAYFGKWRGLAAFQEKVIKEVETERRLINSFGRILEYWNFRWSATERRWICSDREEALAFLPASTVGDMCKALLPKMDECAVRHGAELVNTVHDSFWCLVPDPALAGFVLEARKVMEAAWPVLGRVEPFGEFWCPADVKVGRNFGAVNEENPEGLREVGGA